ncbi:MAG TPA: hypothetical protein VK509_08470 [Polyangiales bacterium]|nr:hypothetical protein [Polyangiales bacterium]
MRWSWLAALVVGIAGCRAEPAVAWLRVTGVRPAALEPGGTLYVQGEGFAAGEPCSVRLRGRTSRPGLPSVRVQLTAAARAISGDEIALRFDPALQQALGVHGSFQGELQVAFAVAGGGAVTGASTVAFDLWDPLGRGVVQAQRAREQAGRLLRFAGITAAADAQLDAGLTIASVRAGSAAARLGLRSGDVIARSAGVSVHALGDLAPPPYARSISWGVRSPDGSNETHVLGLTGLDTPDPGAGLDRVSMLLAWLLGCVLLLGPWPSPALWLLRMRARLQRALRSEVGFWGGDGRAGAAGSRSRLDVLGKVALSALGVAFVRFEPAGFLAVRSVSIYLGLCAASTVLALTGAGTPRARLSAALATIGRMCVMGVLVAAACAQNGTRALDGMVHAQGAWPWEWGVAARPALLAAFPLYVVFASRLGGESLAVAARGPIGALVIGERVITNVVLAALGAAMFAGGWQSPAPWPWPELDPRLVGALAFVLKTWGFAWLLHAARRLALGSSLRAWQVIAGCALVAGLTALEVWLEPAPMLERALGRAVCASAVLVLVFALLERARETARALSPHPG